MVFKNTVPKEKIEAFAQIVMSTAKSMGLDNDPNISYTFVLTDNGINVSVGTTKVTTTVISKYGAGTKVKT